MWRFIRNSHPMSALRSRTDLLNDPIDRSLRQFAIPMAFSFMVNMLYSLIDRYYASRLGDAAIAAIGTSDQITFLVFTLASGFAVGTGIIVSRRIGEGDHAEAGRTAAQAIGGMVTLAGGITILLYLVMPLIPKLMRMEPEVADMAISYMSYLYLGFTANLVNFQIFSVVRSTGNTVFPMSVLIMTTVLNAVLAPFLIFGYGPFPVMGMAGAGLATALSQIMGTVVALWAVTTGKTNIRLRFDRFRPDLGLLLRIGKLGLPASLQMISVSVNRALIFVIVGGYGTSVTAAYTLGLNIDMVVFMSVFALGVAVEVATGQNIGANKPDRVAAYHRSAMKQGAILMTGFAIVVWLAGEYFVRLYTSNPQTLAEALIYLRITVFGYLFFNIGIVTVRAISGAGASIVSMAITAGCLLGLQFPFAWLLSHPLGMGPQGVWYGILVGYIAFSGVALYVHKSGRWKGVSV
ncbi:MAG: MATE family efflux transporter [Ignavibacteriae bacterium]|nr:MAG: MATE family efflux transporter [Ignavibacteriota bacterium]